MIFSPGYFLAALSFHCLAIKAGEGIAIHEPWINESPPGIEINAGYMAIENRSAQAVTLTKVHSDSYARIEIHQSRIVAGMAMMQKREGITIPAKGFISLAPAGDHLMLFDPVKPIRRDHLIKLTFTFSDGSALDCDVPVKQAGPQHQHH